ncbi:hypothetical protein FF38_05413 [Lucilia cuprina]|uniref:Uncharacterized protein n=1 Tax=Lucilia cuprina TaxID=7375 RepID=A0A0L0BXI3_LUCCU|nr:hypothetical protein FF38_05413 [Lucilia cuprina]
MLMFNHFVRLKGINVKDLITKIGSCVSAGAPDDASAASGKGKKEEKKEESRESDDDMINTRNIYAIEMKLK